MKKKRIITLLLMLSVLVNVCFLIELYFNNSGIKQDVPEQNEFGFHFDAISAWFRTDADYSNSEGYFSKLNDTIIIQPFLKVDFIYRKAISLYPLLSLYKFSEADSNLRLIDTIRYQGDNSFIFINQDTCTKLLLYTIDLPVGDSINKFSGAFMMRTEMKNQKKSCPINEFTRDSVFVDFLKHRY